MLNHFSEMLIIALYAMVVQNLVFSACYGLGEGLRMAKQPRHFLMLGLATVFYAMSTSVSCYMLNLYGLLEGLSDGQCFGVYIGVLTVIYLISGFICKGIFRAHIKFMNSLGMCAFNSLVTALPVLNIKAASSLWEVIGLSLGAGLAFILSMLLIRGGMRHINNNKYIPSLFKGTPVLLIYVSLIAMALSCISGGQLFI